MRVNVYAEEMTDRVEIVSKTIDGRVYTGLRLYLYMPVTRQRKPESRIDDNGCEYELKWEPEQIQGPFIHHEGDDDSSAITFWGKAALRDVLLKMVDLLDKHYAERNQK